MMTTTPSLHSSSTCNESGQVSSTSLLHKSRMGSVALGAIGLVLLILVPTTIVVLQQSDSESLPISGLERHVLTTIDSIEDYFYSSDIVDVDVVDYHRDDDITAGSNHNKNNHRRRLQRGTPVCVRTRNDFWETFAVRRRWQLNYYLRRGGILGRCGDVCDEACDHVPCTDDFKTGTDGLTCSCLDNGVFGCKDNTFCDVPTDQCKCNSRYEGNPLVGCTDIDECKTNSCGTTGVNTCTNTPGSYSCECSPNFQWDGNYGSVCRDVNECVELGTNPCGPNSLCTNIPGSFQCFCNPGYAGNPPGLQCSDVDECLTANRCGPSGTCENRPGNYTCNCNSGFIWPGAGSVCTDIDECATTRPCTGKNQVCLNTIGGFTCGCASGYENFPTCSDVNECAKAPSVCGENSICTNTDGGFRCACAADFPGGNPPGEQCRKLNAGESCPNQSRSDLCSTGLECARVSRSDTNFNCCASAARCNVNQRCCNGAYGAGEFCPSGANEDCETGLTCARRSVLDPATVKICCRRVIFLPGVGNVCNT